MFFRPDAAVARPRVHRGEALTVAGAAVIVVAWRWHALAGHREPVGVDIGNWLTLGDALVHGHVSRADTVYPPLVPLVARAVDAVVGMPATAHGLAAFAAVLPGLGVWCTTRRACGALWSALAGLAVAVAGSTSAAAAWGGVPQLLGLGLAPLTALVAAEIAGSSAIPRARVVVCGGLLLVLGATSPLVFGLTVLAVVVASGIAAVTNRTARGLLGVALAAAFVVPLAPLYADYVSDAADALTDGGALGRSIDAVFGGATAWWAVIAVVALLAPWLSWQRRREPIWATSSALLVVAALTVTVDVDARYACFVPTAIAIGAAVSASSAPRVRSRVRRLAPAVVLAGVAGIVVAAPTVMHDQRDMYARFVPSGTTAAITWLERNSRPGDLVAVAPVRGVPFGWLVEGWAKRPSLVGADPVWLRFPGERARAARATRILTATPWPDAAALERARRFGVDWVYLPRGWGGLDLAALRRAAAADPGLVAYEGRGTRILRLGTEPARHRARR